MAHRDNQLTAQMCGGVARAPHLAGVLDVDVVDEFAEQPEIFLTARPQQRLLFVVLHLQIHDTVSPAEERTCNLTKGNFQSGMFTKRQDVLSAALCRLTSIIG